MNKTKTSFIRSPVGKKVLTGITGLALVGFVIEHMLGNLALMFEGSDAYNEYAHFLEGLGPVLYLLEAGLLAFFVFHIVLGISIYLGKRRARPTEYRRYQSAGKPSMQSASSRSMIITGVIMLVFLVIHLWSFKFGPGGPGNADPAYLTTVNGVEMRNLSKLVLHKFSNPLYAFGYPVVMLLLGVHLRHGIWSAFQSLGATNPRMTPVIYTIGGILAVLIAFGFLILPLWVYFGGGAA